MSCSQGAQSRLAISTSTTFNAGSEAYDFNYETVAKNGRLIEARGISGTRSQHVERTRKGTYSVGGRLSLDTCPLDLDKWLPRIMGAPESNNVFALAETLPAFYMLIDRVGGVFRYDSCYVDKAVFRSTAGPGNEDEELVEMILDIVAKDENADQSWPGTIPAIGITAGRSPYILAEGVLTINGGTWEIRDFVLIIDNQIQPRWVNSLTATALCPTDRIVRLRTTNPFTSAEFAGLYDLAAAESGVVATLVFTMGAFSTTFSMAGLQWADQSPVVRGKTEIPLVLDFYARMKSTTRELIVTNVSS